MNQVSVELLVLASDLLKRTEPMPIQSVKIVAGLLTHFSRTLDKEKQKVSVSPIWMGVMFAIGYVLGWLL